MTYRRCQGCREFYVKRGYDPCPSCGTPAYAFSKPLRTAQVNAPLYAQATRAEQEKRAFPS